MNLFVKIQEKVVEMDVEKTEKDFWGKFWARINGEWYPTREQGQESELEDYEYMGEEKQ
jgi:hypothetical protein